MENSLKLVENTSENPEEKQNQKLAENSFSSTETLEIYDLKTGQKLDFEKTFDSNGMLFNEAMHIFEKKAGKIYVKRTSTGKLRNNPWADKKKHMDNQARKVAELNEKEAAALEAARKKVVSEQEEKEHKQYVKSQAGYTATVIVEAFFEFGSWLCGPSFKPSGDDQEAETSRLQKAVEDWVNHHDISMSPDMALVTVAAGYCVRHKPEPGTPAGKFLGFKEPKKAEITDESKDS